MPVPPRQQVPALLQVDAILVRLSGASALDEVCRFVGAELPQFATLAVYRADERPLRRLTNAEALRDGGDTLAASDGAVARALAQRRAAVADLPPATGGEAPSEVAVPVLDEDRVTAVLYASSRFSRAFDATDGRFLEQVAAKLRGAVAAASAGAPPGA